MNTYAFLKAFNKMNIIIPRISVGFGVVLLFNLYVAKEMYKDRSTIRRNTIAFNEQTNTSPSKKSSKKFQNWGKKSKRFSWQCSSVAQRTESMLHVPEKFKTFGKKRIKRQDNRVGGNSSRIFLMPRIEPSFNFYSNKKNNDSLKDVGLEPKPPTILAVLREALLVNPLRTWKLRHKYRSMEDVGVHESVLYKVIRNPWNERLKHKLYKVLRGEHVYLDLFGGSNSLQFKGQGFSFVILDWWNKTITPITGSKLKFRQVALGGISAEFFQFCFGCYAHKNLDLVFIESAVNDIRKLTPYVNRSLPLEQFTRQVLSYPTEPALVYVNFFAGWGCLEYNCKNMEDIGQDLLTDTYNITSLKWRNAVCLKNSGTFLKHPCDLVDSDGFHINRLGHAHISLMIINLFRKILLDKIANVITNSRLQRLRKLPRVFHRKRFKIKDTSSTSGELSATTCREKLVLPGPVYISKATKLILKPLCWTNVLPYRYSADDVKIDLDVVVNKTKGFYLKNSDSRKCDKNACHLDVQSSWIGKTVGAVMALAVTVPGGNSSLGTPLRLVETSKTRSVAIGMRQCADCGAVNVWLDTDHKNKKYVEMKLDYGRISTAIVATRVQPGNHTVNIEIVREGQVVIVALMVGPADGPYE